MLNKNFRDNFYILEICTHKFYIHFFFFFTKSCGLFGQFSRPVFRAFISLSNQFFGILFFLFKLPLLFHFFFLFLSSFFLFIFLLLFLVFLWKLEHSKGDSIKELEKFWGKSRKRVLSSSRINRRGFYLFSCV